MAGELVPVEMVPRYSTYCGATDFLTIAMDVSRYSAGQLTAWRGPAVGTTPTFGITCQESSDGVTWATCADSTADTDPGANTEVALAPTFSRRFFRIKITLGGTSPVATCWISGFLEQRVS